MWVPLSAHHELAKDQNRPLKVLYALEHKTWYILIHPPHNHTVAIWYISNIPQGFHNVKYFIIPPYFIQQQYLWNIAIQPAVGCSVLWGNIHCSDCSALGEKYLWNGLLHKNIIRASNQFWSSHCGLVASYGVIDQGNGLLSDGNKPLSKIMLTASTMSVHIFYTSWFVRLMEWRIAFLVS